MELHVGATPAWVQVPASAPHHGVALGRCLHLPQPWLPSLRNGPKRFYLTVGGGGGAGEPGTPSHGCCVSTACFGGSRAGPASSGTWRLAPTGRQRRGTLQGGEAGFQPWVQLLFASGAGAAGSCSPAVGLPTAPALPPHQGAEPGGPGQSSPWLHPGKARHCPPPPRPGARDTASFRPGGGTGRGGP